MSVQTGQGNSNPDGWGRRVRFTGAFPIAMALCLAVVLAVPAMAAISGAIYTSTSTGSTVNANIFTDKADVYLNGGPQNGNAGGLSPTGTYYFTVTDPSGSNLLSTDDVSCRQVQVVPNSGGAGVVYGVPSGGPPTACTTGFHAVGSPVNPANGSLPVQLIPYGNTTNNGGVYKVWMCTTAAVTKTDLIAADCKTDNFKVTNAPCVTSCGGTPQSLISGVKFYDANKNGVLDTIPPAEVPLANWEIDVTYTSGGILITAQARFTDPGGNWSVFADQSTLLTACEVPQTGWSQSAPVSATPAPAGFLPSGGCWTGTVPATDTTTGLIFGNYPVATVATTISSSTVALGATVHDTATVTGNATFTPTGTVTYTFFSGTCSTGTQISAEPVTLNTDGSVPDSSSTSSLAAGSYYFLAHYGGDSHYAAADGPCEPLTVSKANLTLTTVVHTDTPDAALSGDASLGTSLHDLGHVAGLVSGFPPVTGTVVTFKWYNGGTGASDTCTGGTSHDAGSHGIDTATGNAHPSGSTGALGAGYYAFQASLDLTTDPNYTVGGGASGKSPCEPFEVSKGTLAIKTDLKSAGPLTLGGTQQDSATVTGIISGFDPTGSVSFLLFTGGSGDCASGTSVSGGGGGAVTFAAPKVYSDTTGALGAGQYAYNATLANSTSPADPNYTYPGSPSACEPFKVSQGTSTLATTLKDASNVTIAPNGFVTVGTMVHDQAQVTVTPTFAAATGSVTFRFYSTSASCTADTTFTSGTPEGTIALNGSGLAAPSTSTAALAGTNAFKANWPGDTNYTGSTSPCEPFTVTPPGFVTDTMFCNFDVDPGPPGQQFHLIYTPDATASTTSLVYKLNASNPGQWYYNAFYYGPAGNVTITIPAPFITQGAQPVHVYSAVNGAGVSLTNSSCGTAGGITPVGIGTPYPGSASPITVPVPAGFSYINVHVDFALKGQTNYTPSSTTAPIDAKNPNLGDIVKWLTNYTFSDSTGSSATIQNENVFKNDPGIAGFVISGNSLNPISNVTITISSTAIPSPVTLHTDQDGWYQWLYKYTGKAVSFTIVATGTDPGGPGGLSTPFSQTQTVSLKSNGFLIVNFTAP